MFPVAAKCLWLLAISFCLPLRHIVLTSGYGYRIHPLTHRLQLHSGVDLRAHQDTVFAIMNGVVNSAAYDLKLGYFIRISHYAGIESIYGHLSLICVAAGDSVRYAQTIGLSGASGEVTGEHLHFAIRCNGQYIDPLKFLYQIHLLLNSNEHE